MSSIQLDKVYDVAIIGSGMGGSAFAYALQDTGAHIIILERGDYLKQEDANWDANEVVLNKRYEAGEMWFDAHNQLFDPRAFYNVGGSSKVYGASMFRYREEDFAEKQYPEGNTVAWPITYKELMPFYDVAERALGVRGNCGEDPTEPLRDAYPFPAVQDEPVIADIRKRLKTLGLAPFFLPVSVHQGAGGHCQKGSVCDGFPCKIRAKGDAENSFLRPAMRHSKNIHIATGVYVKKLLHDVAGKNIAYAEVRTNTGSCRVRAKLFVLAAGAVNSAAVLLRSASEKYPQGLSNTSGQVGLNFMTHNATVLMALSPWKKNPTQFQKTLAINDFYRAHNSASKFPLGNIQMRGKILPQHLRDNESRWVRMLRHSIALRSVDFWIMSEDLPGTDNRVEIIHDEGIRLVRHANNMYVHHMLVQKFSDILKQCGFPIVIAQDRTKTAIQHQCGTIRFGNNPKTSVLNTWCRSHALDNLYVVDASVFPSAAAVNPALTIAANALRVGAHVKKRIL